jgi:HEPN domain-containing protein
VVSEWAEKAEHDFQTAVQILKLGKVSPTEIVCFHAQQCVEKYLKAILVREQILFPKTHDIARLLAMVPHVYGVVLGTREQDRLTDYAANARYPGMRDIPLAEARKAVALARRLRQVIRRGLAKKDPKRTSKKP